MEWPENLILRLRADWDEGLSASEIARRLGVTKNAVVGKAHRLDLPARPSPIRRDPSAAALRGPRPRRVRGPTLPPLPATGIATPSPVTNGNLSPTARSATSLPTSPPEPAAKGRIVTCCWPMGEPGTRSFRFCDEPSDPGKPYCEQHAKRAHSAAQPRRPTPTASGAIR